MPAKRKSRKPRKVYCEERTWWTDEQRATILTLLDLNDGNITKTSQETGCPTSTISCWKNGHRHPEALQLQKEKRGDLALAFEEVAWQAVSLAPEKIGDATFAQTMTGAAIAVDKMRLLRGEPTNYNRNDNINANVSLDKLAESLRYEQRAKLRAVLETIAGDSESERTAFLPESGGRKIRPLELPPLPESGIPTHQPGE